MYPMGIVEVLLVIIGSIIISLGIAKISSVVRTVL